MMPAKTIQIVLRAINNGWLQTIVVSSDRENINTGEQFYPNLPKLLEELKPSVLDGIVELGNKERESAPK